MKNYSLIPNSQFIKIAKGRRLGGRRGGRVTSSRPGPLASATLASNSAEPPPSKWRTARIFGGYAVPEIGGLLINNGMPGWGFGTSLAGALMAPKGHRIWPWISTAGNGMYALQSSLSGPEDATKANLQEFTQQLAQAPGNGGNGEAPGEETSFFERLLNGDYNQYLIGGGLGLAGLWTLTHAFGGGDSGLGSVLKWGAGAGLGIGGLIWLINNWQKVKDWFSNTFTAAPKPQVATPQVAPTPQVATATTATEQQAPTAGDLTTANQPQQAIAYKPNQQVQTSPYSLRQDASASGIDTTSNMGDMLDASSNTALAQTPAFTHMFPSDVNYLNDSITA